MKIAFDLHGVLDSDLIIREFVNILTTNSRFEIFVISGPPMKQISEELLKLELYTASIKVVSIVDFLKYNGIEMWQDKKGNWWCSDKEWWQSKGLICKQFKIDLIFDDKIEYSKYMPEHTRFILWQKQNYKLVEVI
jgi:hypothetical protein